MLETLSRGLYDPPAMISLAHLSDPHLPLVGSPRFWQLANKRVLGYLNWLIHRRHVHQWRPLHAIANDIADHRPDHIALAGDLINLSLPREFEAASRWIDALGSRETVSVVPGNHDAYVPVSPRRGLDLWRSHMLGSGLNGAKIDFEAATLAWPYVRRIKQVALICLNSGEPTAPFMATGSLGTEQIDKAGQLLDAAAREGLFRVVMVHHPPLPGQTRPHRRLLDAGAFAEMIRGSGAELIIHGHDHVDSVIWTEGPDGFVPVVCVPSASATGTDGYPTAQWNLYQIRKTSNRWHVEMTARGFDPASGVMETRYTRLLEPDEGAA